ncbi:endonuclease/exonuclease/phosphatase family protein [Oceaniglobus roseus]|uniref:endonuclease/exonuclease/phosphatase family protein n=1 Tax=Oceaniglobus roseus TaxID=1737570 RepID=UPI000C7F13F8|nr:endonuclease/exonuclease/phosphatase family protein [Kandeliimicrobium roseum]
MRIATYNVEWFDSLFDRHDRLIEDNAWSARWNVTRRAQAMALGVVFATLDADAVMVIEAPDHGRRRSTVRALERFAARFRLRARKALIGFPNDTQQEIALMYDPDVLEARHDPQAAPDVPRFDTSFLLDLDTDARPEAVVWSKPPLEVALRSAAGKELRLIGVHAKSKAPRDAPTPEAALRDAIANRRKGLAQCIWLRARVDRHLAAGEPLIVLGDFNDGPGLDEYEKLFGRSGVEIVLGENGAARLFDPHAHAILARRGGAAPTSARFWIREEERWLQALLDYVMVSPDLMAHDPRWRIWHPFEDAACFRDSALREALLTASDHFPVTLDIDI